MKESGELRLGGEVLHRLRLKRDSTDGKAVIFRADEGVTLAIDWADLGTQTSKRPVCSASTVASATCSGVRILEAREALRPVPSSVPTMLGMTTLTEIPSAPMLFSSPRSASLRPTTACLVAT